MLGLKDAIIIAGQRYMMPFIDKKYSITHRSYHQLGTDIFVLCKMNNQEERTGDFIVNIQGFKKMS